MRMIQSRKWRHTAPNDVTTTSRSHHWIVQYSILSRRPAFIRVDKSYTLAHLQRDGRTDEVERKAGKYRQMKIDNEC